MAIPSKPHKPLANSKERTDPVAEAGDRFAAEVRCLREVMDEVREDLSWLTRNGLPVQPVEHVHVKRMARDVTAVDWSERLSVERTMLHAPGQLSGVATPELRRLAEELQSAVEHLMEGQIGPVLKAIDEVQAALIDAMQQRETEPSGVARETWEEAAVSPPPFHPENPKPPSVRPGRLF